MKKFFWRFKKRYGMGNYYQDEYALLTDFEKVFGRPPGGKDYNERYGRVHVDPRGNCGGKGKVLCYKRHINGALTYLFKHRRNLWARCE